MTKFLFTIGIIFLPFIVKADIYTSYCLNLTIETEDTSINCYTIVSPFYFNIDSVANQKYLLNTLPNLDYDGNNEVISFYHNKMEYLANRNGEIDTIQYFSNRDSLSTKEIKTLTIKDHFTFSNISNIANSLSKNDLSWMNSSAIAHKQLPYYECESYGGYCSIELFIHEENEQINEIIRQLFDSIKPNEQAVNEEEIEALINKLKAYPVIVMIDITE